MAITSAILSFGPWLKQAREKRGLTALALAERAGYSHVTIHNIEHEKKGVKRETVEALANALATDTMTDNDRLRLRNEALLAAGFAPETPEILNEPFDEDTLEVAHFYHGIADPRMKAWVKNMMRTAVEITDKEPDDAGPSGNGTD